MEEIEKLIADGNLSVHLDSLLDSRISCKDIDNITPDWTLWDDIEITPEKYVAYSPLVSDFISDTCSSSSSSEYHIGNKEQNTESDKLKKNNDVHDKVGENDESGNSLVSKSSKASASSVSSDCKSYCSENDTQYDSGVGESLSGGEDADLNASSSFAESPFDNNNHQEQVETDSNNNSSEKTGRRRSTRNKNNADKQYNLRTSSVINRIETNRRRVTPKQPKPKTRPPPLSKYRRKTANARERTRMEEISQGFDQLQGAIPQLPKSKLTKITTLRLAINYIRALRELLGYEEDISNVSPMEVIANE